MSGGGNEESRLATAGYYKASKFLYCQSCSTDRLAENVTLVNGRMKCSICRAATAAANRRLKR